MSRHFTNVILRRGFAVFLLCTADSVEAQLTASVDVVVTEQDGLFTYDYTINNAVISSLPVNLFLLDVASGDEVVLGENLEFGVRSLAAPDLWVGEYQPYELELDEDFNATGIKTDQDGQPESNRTEEVVFLSGDGLSCGPGPNDVLEGDSLTISITSEYGPDTGSYLVASWDLFCEFLGDASGSVLVPSLPPAGANCDFDGDGDCDLIDIDQLGAEIAAGTNLPDFDLNSDDLVDMTDLELFLGHEKVQKLNGDANFNGSVDFDDFVALSNHFGQPASWSNGDFLVNGTVDFDDFVLLSNHFGNSFAAGTAAVPEPGSALLWLLAIAGLTRLRRLT